jgi:hypothetical protein
MVWFDQFAIYHLLWRPANQNPTLPYKTKFALPEPLEPELGLILLLFS